MATGFEITAESRTDSGKGASRRLRHAGKVPAIIYGGGKDPQSLTLSHNELLRNLEHEAFYSNVLSVKVDGKETQAIIRDIQRHPAKPVIMHMDFLRVSATEKLKMQIPVHIIGEEDAPGIKAGGLVAHDATELTVECLPKDLPEYIEIDISALEIGDSLHLSDIKFPEGVSTPDLGHEESTDYQVVSMHARPAIKAVEEEAPEGDAGEAAAEGGEEAKDSGEGESS